MVATIKAYGALAAGFKVTPEIKKAAEKARDFAVTKLREKTPVKTGLLKSSWQVGLEGYGLSISNETPYSMYVEMGTKKMIGRRMLSQTLPEIQAYFKKQLAQEVGKKLSTRIIGDLNPTQFMRTGYGTKDTAAYSALSQGTAYKPKSLNLSGGLGFKAGKTVGLQDHPKR